MENGNRIGSVEALEQIREDPLLGDFAVPLPQLSPAGSQDLGRTFERLAELIGASEQTSTIRFNITDDDGVRSWSLTSGPSGYIVTTGPEQVPVRDVEIFVEAETWRQIAEGHMSPLEAFGRGKMRVRGDLNCARRIMRRLSANEDEAII